MRANVEDLLLVATLLDKYKTPVDLRPELDLLLKDSNSAASDDSLVKKMPKFGEKKSTKNGIIFFLKAGQYQ